MTVQHKSVLSCDHREHSWSRPCYAHAKQGGGMSTSLMRTFAREAGWIMIKGKDYCPEHAPLHPTHGTVQEEMVANGYVADENGKMHIPMREACR